MVDWPGTQTKVNPYWFRAIVGGDVSSLLGRINTEEQRVLIGGADINALDVAVDESDTIFIRNSQAGNNEVALYDQVDYAPKGQFTLLGMTLNGESVLERWLGWGPGGFLYTWGFLMGAIQTPRDDTIWYVGVNRYDTQGFVGFWEDEFNEFHSEGTPNLGQASVSVLIGGDNQTVVWISFRKIVATSNNVDTFFTWLRRYTTSGTFQAEVRHTLFRDVPGFNTRLIVILKRGGGENWLLVEWDSSTSFTTAVILDEDMDDASIQEACIPINPLFGASTGLFILNQASDYMRTTGQSFGTVLNSFESFMAPGDCTTIAQTWSTSRYVPQGIEPLASKQLRSDPRYFICGGGANSNTPGNKVFIADYEEPSASSLIATISLVQFIAYTLTDWYKFPNNLWDERIDIGTFPVAGDFDNSIALWQTLLQARVALDELIPNFLNSVTGNVWKIPGGTATDPDNIYEQSILAGVADDREYGAVATLPHHGFNWFHPYIVSSGNPQLSPPSSAMRAIDFGEIHEIILMLASSNPAIEQL